MKLKSPKETHIQVALLSGHCLVVPPEGREIPQMFVQEAFKQGCVPMETDVEEFNRAVNETQAKSKKEIVTAAVKQMLEEGDKLTGTGMPNLLALSRLVGMQVTKEELVEIMQELEKEVKPE